MTRDVWSWRGVWPSPWSVPWDEGTRPVEWRLPCPWAVRVALERVVTAVSARDFEHLQRVLEDTEPSPALVDAWRRRIPLEQA